MRNIGSYFKVVDADEHRIIEELRSLREKKRKDAYDITAADAAKAKSISIREGYARANELMEWSIHHTKKGVVHSSYQKRLPYRVTFLVWCMDTSN